MIEIVVAVCMIDEPERCKDVRLTYMAETVTVQQCMMFGQAEIAKWSEGHPNWRITRWSCGTTRQMAKI